MSGAVSDLAREWIDAYGVARAMEIIADRMRWKAPEVAIQRLQEIYDELKRISYVSSVEGVEHQDIDFRSSDPAIRAKIEKDAPGSFSARDL